VSHLKVNFLKIVALKSEKKNLKKKNYIFKSQVCVLKTHNFKDKIAVLKIKP
jgi:hypothetical protein